MNILPVKKQSAWEFQTSSTAGAGLEFVLAEGGALYFKDPSGQDVSFTYGAAGVGIAAGLKLPKIGKLEVKVKGKAVGAAIAPASFPNGGQLYILDTFKGDELAQKDIRGACALVQIGGGIIAGVSASAMVVGMDPLLMAAMMLGGPQAIWLEPRLLESATGVLVVAGANVSAQVGGGAGALIGGLY